MKAVRDPFYLNRIPLSALKTAFVWLMLFAKENRLREEVTRQLLPDAKSLSHRRH